MNFLDIKEIKNYIGTLKRTDKFTHKDSFDPIVFDRFSINICAGPQSFSKPQSEFNNLLHYDEVHMYLFEHVKLENRLISPRQDDRFSSFEWSKYFLYTDHQGKQKFSYMGTHIPINDLLHLIREVYKVNRLKFFY